MLKIQQHVITKDKEIKKQATRVQKGMSLTVDLEGLAIKIYGKYLKFLQQKVQEIMNRPPITTNTKKDELEEKKKRE